MKTDLRTPLIITPRLMPGARIANGFLSIGYSDLPGNGGRTRYHYAIDVDGQGCEGHDLQSGSGGGDLQDGFRSFLAFLIDAAEGCGYELRTGRAPESAGSFPLWVSEWAYDHSDELEALSLDLEIDGLIEEAF